ncbi:hypothetical protein [Aureispira sp. CCB-E]|uniref:hypothetical protein n=1 Tax=Aureispira sp. CCB-E TaxID=3051121 RepID=UPI002868978F|nr:hypothetical protein [Aureispira sp. CCB-E]WMX14539.1 hypothetical protein QP953_27150 [Aureispira sp. CCB-E]
MPPLKIRYRTWFLALNVAMAFLLILLAWYTQSTYRIILGAIWILISLNNMYTNAVLELTDQQLILRNGLGIVSQNYDYKGKNIVVREKAIYLDEKRVYKHLFTFSPLDFERVRAYLDSRNPELNLGRHLIENDLS